METRAFQIDHNKLLLDVIRRQAGSLTKAILEGVMNAVDAKATECTVTVAADYVTIRDNGFGFKTKADIQTWFEVFGAMHAETEQKTFGTFRMGRGQMFAFGKNTWLTNEHSMVVDIEKYGCSYQYGELNLPKAGCDITIELYKQISEYDVSRVVRELCSSLCWLDMPVTVNDRSVQASRPEIKPVIDNDLYTYAPAGDNAWELKVYNQGVFVRCLPSSMFGSGGVLLFKKPPKVNFARNDIQEDCPLWQEVKAELDAFSNKACLEKTTLTNSERTSLRQKIGARALQANVYRSAPIVSLVTGKHCKLADLLATRLPICAAPKGDKLGDFAHRTLKAFVLSTECLSDFGYTKVSDFCSWLNSLSLTRYVFTASELGDVVDESRPSVFPGEKLLTRERKWKEVLEQAGACLYDTWENPRSISIGESATSLAWTDGRSFICFDRNYLKRLPFTNAGLFSAGCTLLHEICHADASGDQEHHDQAFYERYHDRSEKLFRFVESARRISRQYAASR